MAKLTRQLHKLTKGGNEECWRLVFDTETQRLYIEHEWSHTDEWRASRSSSGTAEFDIDGFLAEGEAPAQAELQRIIESLFKKMEAARIPKGPKGKKRPADVIGAAVMVGRIATGEIEDPAKAKAPPAKPIKRPRSRPAKKS
jgi:hypothetical protein